MNDAHVSFLIQINKYKSKWSMYLKIFKYAEMPFKNLSIKIRKKNVWSNSLSNYRKLMHISPSKAALSLKLLPNVHKLSNL